MMVSRPFWENKRVFLTGHTGLKGSWLALWLQRLGAEVVGFSLEHSGACALEKAGAEACAASVVGDIRDFSFLNAKMKEHRPEIVIHMAAQALVRRSYRDPLETYSTNVMGTAHVLEAARNQGIRVVLNVTSDKCYENQEWDWGYRENDPMGGHDPYSSSKGCAELVTSAYRRSFFESAGLASARAGNVVGGGDWSEDRLIPDCMRALTAGKPIFLRNPGSVRPWQHVLDPLSGYLRLVECLWNDPKRFSDSWNFGPDVCDARPVSWIAEHVARTWGGGARWEIPEHAEAVHEARFLKLDCSKSHTHLGWRPALSTEQSLDWVIEWYKKNHFGENAREVTLAQIERYENLRNQVT